MTWKLEAKKIKNYPHFDAPLSIPKATALALDPIRVAQNAFYPFLRYDESWQPFRTATEKPKKKSRPISYCARRDAYIFMRYREVLAERYEEKLKEYGISEVPIAYRKIKKSKHQTSGKCNIDFAKDVFDEVKLKKDVVVIALDITKYFDNLDHEKIKCIWQNLIGVDDLPPDHAAVLKAVTKYSYVYAKDAYRRLGYFGYVGEGKNRREGYLQQRSDIPKQLSSPKDFRNKILGGDPNLPSLLKWNWKPRGIPQGSPISDVIANFYLLEYDREMTRFARRHGGSYRRYSDDILFILPSDSISREDAERHAMERISAYGDHLVIKSSKTSVVEFRASGDRLIYCHQSGKQGANGLEYLGFRFDGTEVFIRDSTISRYYRKIAIAARAEARYLIDKYPGEDAAALMKKLNMSVLLQRWNRVMKFRTVRNSPKKWTFRTYALRAADTFNNGDIFIRQLSNTNTHLKIRVEKSLIEFLTKQ